MKLLRFLKLFTVLFLFINVQVRRVAHIKLLKMCYIALRITLICMYVSVWKGKHQTSHE